MSVESEIKEYQYKKYRKCIQCKEPVSRAVCTLQCNNCGYTDN